MKYKTIIFNANQPIVQQITEPLDSEYGIAVKVYKDGEPISADLSIGETICTEGPDGWHLAELSSGNVETMKIVDVDVAKDPTINKEINPIGEAVNASSRTKTVQIIVPLSAFFDSDITIKPEDVKVLSCKARFADDTAEYSDDWVDANNSVTTTGKWMTFQDNNQKRLMCVQNGSSGYVNCWYKPDTATYEYGEKTIPTSFGIWLYSGALPGHKKCEYSAVIEINTKDGLKTKFTLYVQEKNLGYIEMKGISEEPEPETPVEEPTNDGE